MYTDLVFVLTARVLFEGLIKMFRVYIISLSKTLSLNQWTDIFKSRVEYML